MNLDVDLYEVLDEVQLVAMTVWIIGVVILTIPFSPYLLILVGALVFFFGLYARGGIRQDRAVRYQEELMNDYQAQLIPPEEISECCLECSQFDWCKSHDPHAGCENEARKP